MEFIDDCISTEYLLKFLNENLQKSKIVVASPWFVCENKLEITKEMLLNYGKKNNCKMNIQCIYFENDPIQCLQNVKYRNDGRKVNSFIKNYTKGYKIPIGVTPIKIFKTQLLDK